jgi:tetratricopeptide (TPR) repeat protein
MLRLMNYPARSLLTLSLGCAALCCALAARAAAQFPRLAEIQYLIGYAARGEGLYDDAIAAFRRALDAQPDNADAIANLGFIASERGQTAEADTLLRRGIALDPKHYPAHYDLGKLLMRLRRYDEALAVFERGLAPNDSDPGIRYQLFTVYSRLRRKPEAERELAIFKRLEEARKTANGDAPATAGSAMGEPAAAPLELPASAAGESSKPPSSPRR